MSANREKTSSVMGFVISVLLHGIFFAGCLALDASSVSASSTASVDSSSSQLKTVTDHTEIIKPKS